MFLIFADYDPQSFFCHLQYQEISLIKFFDTLVFGFFSMLKQSIFSKI